MSEMESRCVSVFAKTMEVPAEVISVDTDPSNLAQWDSLSHVQLIVALENEFSLQITPEEGIELESYRLVVDFMKQKLAQT